VRGLTGTACLARTFYECRRRMNNCDSSQFECPIPSHPSIQRFGDSFPFCHNFGGCLRTLCVCFNFSVTVKWIKVFPSAYILKRVQPLSVGPPSELHYGLPRQQTHFSCLCALRKTEFDMRIKHF